MIRAETLTEWSDFSETADTKSMIGIPIRGRKVIKVRLPARIRSTLFKLPVKGRKSSVGVTIQDMIGVLKTGEYEILSRDFRREILVIG